MGNAARKSRKRLNNALRAEEFPTIQFVHEPARGRRVPIPPVAKARRQAYQRRMAKTKATLGRALSKLETRRIMDSVDREMDAD